MFFTSISQMMTESVDLTLVIRKANGQLTVSTLPKANGLKDEAQNHIIPLTLTGTPEEMDAGFLQAVMQPVRKATGLISNMVEFEKQADKAAANSKAAKDAKAKETKEEKEKREKYEKHFKKAEELIAAKNSKDAIATLQQARLYAKAEDQKKVDDMIAAQKKAMNQGSLFELMEEQPAPQAQAASPQTQMARPAQPVQQPQMPPQPQQPIMRSVQQPMQRPVPVQRPTRPQYAEQPQYAQQPQGGYSQMPPRQPQAGQQGHMFPAQEQPPLPPEDYGHYSAMPSDEPAYRPEDYEDYPDFPQSMLENHYSHSYNQTV